MAVDERKQVDTIDPLVYLVDDNKEYREEAVYGLSALGIDAHGFADASALYRAYAARPCDIVILDIGLDGEDGLTIAGHLRAAGPIGIIMATGRGSVDDRIDGLRKGADMYLVKPIDLRELAAAVSALGLRLKGHGATVMTALSSPGWVLAEGGWTLSDGLGHSLRLTSSEQLFLRCLFDERGRTVSRQTLIEAMSEDSNEFSYIHLDVIVSRLRKRAIKGNMILPLLTVRGIGFRFSE